MQTSANNKSTCACSSLPPKMTKIPLNIGAHVLIESARASLLVHVCALVSCRRPSFYSIKNIYVG